MTHETRKSYLPYWTVSLAVVMVRTQTDFNHAHTKKQDIRVFLRVKDVMNCGFKSVMIRIVNT